MSSKQTANGPHPAAAESSPHPHNHLRLGRTSDPFLSVFVYAVYISHSLRFVMRVSTAAGRQEEAECFCSSLIGRIHSAKRLIFRFGLHVFLLKPWPCFASCSLLPPYGGFNHTVLVQIFYICFHSYNFNSTQRINQGTQNTF